MNEEYFLYFGSGGGTWLPCESIFDAVRQRDTYAGRCGHSVKDWHIIQKFNGYWFDIV